MSSLNEQLSILIQDEIENLPKNQIGVVKKIYNDGFVDVWVNDTVLKHLQVIGEVNKDERVFISFLNGDSSSPIAVTGNTTNTIYVNDLSVDLDLKFGLSGRDDTIIIKTDLINGNGENKIINI